LVIFAVAACSANAVVGQTAQTVLAVGVVGGVAIDAESVLSRAGQRIDAATAKEISNSLEGADTNIDRVSKLRMVSLKSLDREIKHCIDNGKQIPVEVQFMAGLQRVEFLIVDAENNDLILAGPGEGLTTDAFGNVVGAISGTPAIHLEDFLTAMRTVDEARSGQGISVSMNPTPEGIKNLRAYYDKFQFSPDSVEQIQQAMGEHTITLTGVPNDSRYSQVLVAADHRMKRLAMGLDQSNARNMPSILEMAKKASARRMQGAPRMWMECNYQSVATDEANTIYELRGQGIKTLTENAMFDQEGQAKAVKKQNKFAEKWANDLTDRFEEVSKVEPVFRDLRNLMDLSVISAIIAKNKMLDKMGLEIDAITGDAVQMPSRPVPSSVPTACSFVNIKGNYVVTASGGVQVDSWAVAGNTEIDAELAKQSAVALAAKDGNNWWWNAN
jgi:hypothetical protein